MRWAGTDLEMWPAEALQLTIAILYSMGDICKKMGRHEYIEYYLEIVTVLREHGAGEGCHHDAWKAAWQVCEYYHNRCQWLELQSTCATLWYAFLHGAEHADDHHHHFFTEELVVLLYSHYKRALDAVGSIAFHVHYEITLQYKATVFQRFGHSCSAFLKALIALADICSHNEEHHHESVTTYEEVIRRSVEVQTEVITEKTITVVKKRLSKVYVTVISKGGHHRHKGLGERALELCLELYAKLKIDSGCWHEETLCQLEIVLAVLRHDEQDHRQRIVQMLQIAMLEVVKECHDTVLLYRAALRLSAFYATFRLHSEAKKLLWQLHHLIVLPEMPCGETDFEVAVCGSDMLASLVFLVTCQQAMGFCPELTYTEVMAASLLEVELWQDFAACLKAADSVEYFLQVSGRLYRFWTSAKRTSQCQYLLRKVLAHFTNTDFGLCLAEHDESQLLVFVELLLDHMGFGEEKHDLARTCCHAVNVKVKQLLLDGQFSEAHSVATCGFALARAHHFYRGHISLGYKLAEYMAGIDIPDFCAGDDGLAASVRATSREVIEAVLLACHEADINFCSLRFEDVQGFVRLLGEQENFQALEQVLLQLWQSREVQRTWGGETVLSIGSALVHAHVAADHLDKAIALCDVICYNLRRWGDWVDSDALEASGLLAQLYTLAGQHDRAMAVHEEVLREIDEDGTEAIFSTHARKHLHLFEGSYRRNGGLARDAESYKDLFDSLQFRDLPCDYHSWSLEPLDGDTGGYEAPRAWVLASRPDDTVVTHIRERDIPRRQKSLGKIAARRSYGCSQAGVLNAAIVC